MGGHRINGLGWRVIQKGCVRMGLSDGWVIAGTTPPLKNTGEIVGRSSPYWL
mgnify:CR=1 FL=1